MEHSTVNDVEPEVNCVPLAAGHETGADVDEAAALLVGLTAAAAAAATPCHPASATRGTACIVGRIVPA